MADNLVTEIKKLQKEYPEISNDDLVNIIIDNIEMNLPEIINSIHLPKRETKAKNVKGKFLSLRRKKRADRSISLNREVIKEDIRSIQDYIKVIDSNTNNILFQADNAPCTALIAHPTMEEKRISSSFPNIIIDDASFHYKSRNSELHSMFNHIPNILSENDITRGVNEDFDYGVGLIIDNNCRKLMKKDRIFRNIINQIVEKIEFITKDIPYKFTLDISERSDIEFRDWSKIILKFKLPNFGFNQKIELWDAIDDFIRQIISTVKREKYRLGENARHVEFINRNLFIDVNL